MIVFEILSKCPRIGVPEIQQKDIRPVVERSNPHCSELIDTLYDLLTMCFGLQESLLKSLHVIVGNRGIGPVEQ